MNYWLMKSEPSTFSIDHLLNCPNQTDHWEGVRNYQARNYMRDQMRIQDRIFFYHSNCEVPGIAGIMEVAKESHPDFTALDPDSPYYDPKSTPQSVRWHMVSVRALQKFNPILPLVELKKMPLLQDMVLLKPGNRLSVLPVRPEEWQAILTLRG